MNKKIILVGPVYPYRGGISHYTGLMYRALSKKYDVDMVSFKMQYPKFLLKKEQKDYKNDSFKIDGTKYLINTANPFNIIRTAHYIRKNNPDMVIMQWWHPYFAPCYILLSMFMGRQKLVYVCHNVFPHERFPMDKKLTKWALKKGKHFIVHAAKEAEELLQIKPAADYAVTPHPTYNVFRFENMTKMQARKKLGISIDQKVLLFFGFVRPYKGLKHLLNALPRIVESLGDIKLMVVGEFAGEEAKQEYTSQIANLGVLPYVTIKNGYMPDKEVEKYFAACDMVVLPYEDATQSGIVQIAFGFEKPVIVTRVGGLPDVVKDNFTGYVVPPCNSDSLAAAVVDYFEKEREGCFTQNIRREAYRFSWDRMCEVVEGFE